MCKKLLKRTLASVLTLCTLATSATPTFSAGGNDSAGNGSGHVTGGNTTNIDCRVGNTAAKLSLIVQPKGTYASKQVFLNTWPTPHRDQSMYLLPNSKLTDNVFYDYKTNNSGDFSLLTDPASTSPFKADAASSTDVSKDGKFSRKDLVNIIWNFYNPNIKQTNTKLVAADGDAFFNKGHSYKSYGTFKGYATRLGLDANLVPEVNAGYSAGIRLWPNYMTKASYESADKITQSALVANALAYTTIAAWYKTADPSIDLTDVFKYAMCQSSKYEYLLMIEPMLCWETYRPTNKKGYASVLDAYRIANGIRPGQTNIISGSDFALSAAKEKWKGWSDRSNFRESLTNLAKVISARVWKDNSRAVGNDAERIIYFVREGDSNYPPISKKYADGETPTGMIAGFGIVKAPPNITPDITPSTATHTLTATFQNSPGVTLNPYNWNNPIKTKDAVVEQEVNGMATNIKLNLDDTNISAFAKQIYEKLSATKSSAAMYLNATISKTGANHTKAYTLSDEGSISSGSGSGTDYTYKVSSHPINPTATIDYKTQSHREYDIEGADYYDTHNTDTESDDDYNTSYITYVLNKPSITMYYTYYNRRTEQSDSDYITSRSYDEPLKIELTLEPNKKSSTPRIKDVRFIDPPSGFYDEFYIDRKGNLKASLSFEKNTTASVSVPNVLASKLSGQAVSNGRTASFDGGASLGGSFLSSGYIDSDKEVSIGFDIDWEGDYTVYPLQDDTTKIRYTKSADDTEAYVDAWSSLRAYDSTKGYEQKYLIPYSSLGGRDVNRIETDGDKAIVQFTDSKKTITFNYSDGEAGIVQKLKAIQGKYITLAPMSLSDSKFSEPGSYTFGYKSKASLVLPAIDLNLDLHDSSDLLTVNVTQAPLNVSWNNQPLAFAEVKQGTYSTNRSTETFDAMTGVPTIVNNKPTSFYANFGGTPFYVDVEAHLAEGRINQTYVYGGTYHTHSHSGSKDKGYSYEPNEHYAEDREKNVDTGVFYYWVLDKVQLVPVEKWQINGNVIQNRDSSTTTFADSANSPSMYLNIWDNNQPSISTPAGTGKGTVDPKTGTITFNLNPSGGNLSTNLDTAYGANSINKSIQVAGGTVTITGSHFKEGYGTDANTSAFGIANRTNFDFKPTSKYFTNATSVYASCIDQFRDDQYFINFDQLTLKFTKTDGNVNETYNILTAPTNIKANVFAPTAPYQEHGPIDCDKCGGTKRYTAGPSNVNVNPELRKLPTLFSAANMKPHWHPSTTDGTNKPVWSTEHAMPVIGYQGVPESVNRNNYIKRTNNGQPVFTSANPAPNGVPTGGSEIKSTVVSGIQIKSGWTRNNNDIHVPANAQWTTPYAFDDAGKYSLPNARYDFTYSRQYPAKVGPKDNSGNIIPWFTNEDDPGYAQNPQWFDGYLEKQYTSSAFLSESTKIDLYNNRYHILSEPGEDMYLEYIDRYNKHNAGKWKEVSAHVQDPVWGDYAYNWCGINPIIIHNPLASVGMKLVESKRPDMRIINEQNASARRNTVPALNIDDKFTLMFTSNLDSGILNNTTSKTDSRGYIFSNMYDTKFGATAHTKAARGETYANGVSLKPVSYSQNGDIYGALGKGYKGTAAGVGAYPSLFNNTIYMPSNKKTDHSIYKNTSALTATNIYAKRYWLFVPVDTVYNGASSGIADGPFNASGVKITTGSNSNLLKGGNWYYFTPNTQTDIILNMAIAPSAGDAQNAMYLLAAEAINSNKTVSGFINDVVGGGHLQFEPASTIASNTTTYSNLFKPVNGKVSPLQNSTNLRRAGANIAAHFTTNSITADVIGAIGNPMIDYVEDPDFSSQYANRDTYSTVAKDIFGDAAKIVNQTGTMGVYHKAHAAGGTLPIKTAGGNTFDLGYGFNFSIQTIGSLSNSGSISVIPSYFLSVNGDNSFQKVNAITYSSSNSTQSKIYDAGNGAVNPYPLEINFGKSTTKINTRNESSADRYGNEKQLSGGNLQEARTQGVDKGVRVGTPQKISLENYTRLVNGNTTIQNGDGSTSVQINNPDADASTKSIINHQRWLGSYRLPSSSKFYINGSNTAVAMTPKSNLLIKFDFQTSKVQGNLPENTSVCGVTTVVAPNWSFRYNMNVANNGVTYSVPTNGTSINPGITNTPNDPTTPMAIIGTGKTSADDMSNVGTH